jgi:hypothetical protein
VPTPVETQDDVPATPVADVPPTVPETEPLTEAANESHEASAAIEPIVNVEPEGTTPVVEVQVQMQTDIQ